ncbi:ATP-binding protein [Pseudidiomarina sp. YC-516-91]|uniref:ATP-binding protein n=1 Tax=Pseudidiomarina salilacus TaxID=3384452 RepID=UPI0039848355
MSTIPLPPMAGPFVQSLRSIGYSLESAVADVVDNSISAKAENIEIFTEWRGGKPVLTILDDGIGMSPREVRSAMTLGAVGPQHLREPDDLGRFGMGLKTASFSQCKVLTLISRRSENDPWYGLKWDLNLIEQKNEWLAREVSSDDCLNIMESVGFKPSHGTAVVWSDFDRAIDPTAANAEADYGRRIEILIAHLALTFHRFIAEDDVTRRVKLTLNNNEIEAKDPFATRPEQGRQASVQLSSETMQIGGCSVGIKAYLLPHPSSFSHSFARKVSPMGDHYAGQGVYIYRAGRLLVNGGWQRLAKVSETNKLARIRVDFSNDADSLWKIDVLKSRVELPSALREQLRRVIGNSVQKSSRTFTNRAKMPSTDAEPIWQREYNRELNRVSYVLNKEHTVLKHLLSEVRNASWKSAFLKLVESTLPIELIKNDIAASNIQLTSEPEQLNEKYMDIIASLLNAGLDIDIIEQGLLSDSNIGLPPEQLKNLIKKIGKNNAD